MLARLATPFRRRDASYDPLPSNVRPAPRWRTCRRCSLAGTLVLGMALGAAVWLFSHFVYTPWLFRTRLLAPLFGPHPLPPLYDAFFEAEDALLPQHHAPDPFANGTRYLWVPSHPQWSGWGNWMQDLVMTSHLAYRSGRAFVFDDYSWDRRGPAYSRFDRDRWIPTRIPLSAMISGPIAGGPFADSDPTPRAISRRHWKKICPHPTKINAVDVRAMHGGGASALKIEETWLEVLAKIDDPCVEVIESSGFLFHVFMFGSRDEVMPVWPLLKDSPILQLFGWSSLAHSAFATNRELITGPPTLPAPYTTTPSCPNCADPRAPLRGLLAVHIRRGDFLAHCANLAAWGADFNAFNRFDGMRDPWARPGGAPEARTAHYLRRCLPTTEQIVARVEEVRAQEAAKGNALTRVYVMTNGGREWADELAGALRARHAWAGVATSRELVLTPEERYTAQGMDMMVGERAQAFIGNGFSSLSSNIAMLRMARGHPVDTTWMW